MPAASVQGSIATYGSFRAELKPFASSRREEASGPNVHMARLVSSKIRGLAKTAWTSIPRSVPRSRVLTPLAEYQPPMGAG